MKHTHNRSSLLLLELICNLFLFAVCAAVCVGLLLHARGLSRDSRNLTDAVYMAQTAAEEWRAYGEVVGLEIPLEDGWRREALEENGLLTVRIYKNDALIFALEEVGRIG